MPIPMPMPGMGFCLLNCARSQGFAHSRQILLTKSGK